MGLDIVEMVIAVEKEFHFDIPDAAASQLRSVGDLYWYVREHAPELPRREAMESQADDPVWTRLLEVIEHESGVARAKLVPEARFVEDLQMD